MVKNNALNTTSAKATFGVFKEPQTTGDYIINKKINTVFCPTKKCIPCKSFNSQGNLLLTKNIPYKSINTANLNINLITELNLKNVNVLQTYDMSSNPYFYYDIDPSGQLFGNTVCGTNNFLNYLEYNPPFNP